MTTYYIGPGETYTTFADLVSHVTLVSGDVVDGGGNIFSELWTVAAAIGVEYRDAVIDASGLNIGVSASGRNNATIRGIVAHNSTMRNFYINAGVGNYLIGCKSYGGLQKGFSLYNTGTVVISGCESNADLGGYFFEQTTTATVSDSVAQNAYKDTTTECHGFRVLNSSSVTFDRCRSVSNSGDGFNNNHTSVMTCRRCTAIGNGLSGNNSAGDGFTGHDSCANKIHFCFASGNLKDACGFVGTATGEIYHLTAVNNGTTGVARGELFLTSTGVWTVKNNLICNLNSYPLVRYDNAGAHVFDNNTYISNLAAPFDVSGTMLSFAGWIALGRGDINSIFIHYTGSEYNVYKGSAPSVIADRLSYCPVDSVGRPVDIPMNPIFGVGAIITGVNDGNQRDISGKRMIGPILPGCFQSVGIPMTHMTPTVLS